MEMKKLIFKVYFSSFVSTDFKMLLGLCVMVWSGKQPDYLEGRDAN